MPCHAANLYTSGNGFCLSHDIGMVTAVVSLLQPFCTVMQLAEAEVG